MGDDIISTSNQALLALVRESTVPPLEGPTIAFRRIPVLLVDDQRIVGEAVRRMLEGAPEVDFHSTTDAEGAVAMAEAMGAGVVLVDLVMPGVDGMSLVDAFRRHPTLGEVPLVVLSSHDEPAMKAEAFARGANDYLVKLPDPVELVARVRYHARTYVMQLERNETHERLRRFATSLAMERNKTEKLLLNVMPKSIASRLKGGEQLIADAFTDTTVLFADLVGFTKMASEMKPQDLVEMLNAVFVEYDAIADRLGVEKIKTIGDAYMAATGVPTARPDHASAMAHMALAVRDATAGLAERFGMPLQVRIGMHSGPVVAGIIGTRKFIYDLWGDTVNVASRLESHGEPGRVQCAIETRDLLDDGFHVVERGRVRLKGRGIVRTFFIEHYNAP